MKEYVHPIAVISAENFFGNDNTNFRSRIQFKQSFLGKGYTLSSWIIL